MRTTPPEIMPPRMAGVSHSSPVGLGVGVVGPEDEGETEAEVGGSGRRDGG